MEGKEDTDFIRTLRAYGVQVTYQRLAIYHSLYNSNEHPSAEMVYRDVKKRFPMISLGTVYKTLERFHEVGLIQKTSDVIGVARYEVKAAPHAHMMCLKCHSLQDVGRPMEELRLSDEERKGFKVTSQQLLLQGHCAHCIKGIDASRF